MVIATSIMLMISMSVIEIEGPFAQWLKTVWEMNPVFPLNKPHLWAILVLKMSDLYDPAEISHFDYQRFENLIRKFIKPWRANLTESAMDCFQTYYARTKVLLGGTYQTSLPSSLMDKLSDLALYLLAPEQLTEEIFSSGVESQRISMWYTIVPTPEITADARGPETQTFRT